MKSIPNILTILRLLACPLLIVLFIEQGEAGDTDKLYYYYILILIVFMLACLTDFFDGYLARKRNLKSNFGKILDPIADKALIITIFVMLIIYGAIHEFNKIAFYIIIIRELIISFLRFNLSSVNKAINVSMLSKYKTFIQMLAIGIFLLVGTGNWLLNHTHTGIYSLNTNMRDYTYIFLLLTYYLSIFLFWVAAFITIVTGVQHFKTYLKLKQK